MEKKTKGITKWLYWFLFAVAVIFVYKTIDNLAQITNWVKELLSILAPFAAGILISYILYMPCKKVEQAYLKVKKVKIIKKKARSFSILTVYIIALILLIILINFIVPPIIKSIIDLTNNFTNYYQSAITKINELPEDSFWKTEVITRIMKEIENIDIKQIINVEVLSQYAQGALNVATKIFAL